VRVHAPGATATVRSEAETGAVCITVEDDGPGIASNERERVLRSGVRGSTASATGSGIGLATAAETMKDQAGTLRVTERAGGGTCVQLTLPAAIALHKPNVDLPRSLVAS
ncbi:MAG: ATP-binding protein, partial [Jatrophihabitantaceae bacterium]